jgi:hypothetical protein
MITWSQQGRGVEEFWVCGHCRSLNRASAGKCYSCKQKYGSQPKAATAVVKGSALVAPQPAAAPPIADFRAAAVAPTMPAAAPPVPIRPDAAALPAYLTRPVVLAPAAPGYSAAYSTPVRRGPVFGSPVSAIKRRVAAALAMRQSVQVTWLGYMAMVLVTLFTVIAVGLLAMLLPVAANLLQHGNVSSAWAQLTDHEQGAVVTLAEASVALGVLAMLAFSVLVGLSTHNATGLGAAAPLLTPYGGGIVWPIVVWNQIRIGVGLVVPITLVWLGYTIPGVMATLVAVEIAQRHIDDPVGWLTRPYRHLPDLYTKLGTEGTKPSPLTTAWSVSFRAANVLAIVTFALPLLALGSKYAASFLGHDGVPGWQAAGLGPTQMAVLALAAGLVVSVAGAVVLTVPIAFGLIQRQRTRRTLVRVGRSRSWVARPGQGGYTGGHPDPTDPGFDPDDRVIERYPTFPGGSPTGAPGYGTGGRPGFGVGSVQSFGPSTGQGSPDFGPAGAQPFGPSAGPVGPQGFSPQGFAPAPFGPGQGGPVLTPGFNQAGPQGFAPAPFGPGQGGPVLTPGFNQAGPQGFGPGGPQGFGQVAGPGWGPTGPQRSGPGFPPDPRSGTAADQASLNSPSTTSSFPWSEEPSEPAG